MKTNKIVHGFCIIIWIVFVAGCNEFVEIDLPPSQLLGHAVFADRATATSALGNIYSGLRDNTLITGNSHGIGDLLGNYSDEFEYYGNITGNTFNFFEHNILSTNSELSTLWDRSYNLIYACNSLLNGLDGNTAINKIDREQIQGEAIFLRSFIHFYLTLLYGDIPYITTTDYKENSRVRKLKVAEIHQLLVSDLGKSIGLLSESYVVPGRVRINRYAAKAFLARIQLYVGDWEASQSVCNEIIARTDLYEWEENLDRVFLKQSKGTLWQLKPESEGGNTLEAMNFIFDVGPPPSEALTQSLIESFDSNDQRLVNWTNSITDGNKTWYHPYKYKARGITSSTLENSVVFRLAELYLIRAEARMKLNDFDGAMSDLNKVRNRAGLPYLFGLDKEGLEDAILEERRHELFTEFGHRWFDLKRFQRASEALKPIKPNWREENLLFPIPQKELLANPNLNPQNNGY